MIWHVHYRQTDAQQVATFQSPEAAIEAACLMIDDYLEVVAIGTGSLDDSITGEQIARIYAIWARAKAPFGIGPG